MEGGKTYIEMEGGKTAYVFTINALSHCDWRDCPERLVEQAQGKTVLLVAEEDNVDPHAVRVHFGGKVAGYVCRDDAPAVSASLVNTLVSEKKISELSRHRDLYTVLNECGIYDKSESNWNQQVR